MQPAIFTAANSANYSPALLLNATWVETGYRVAVSPFPLAQFGGGTLYSVDEVKRDLSAAAPQADLSLMEAAVVSARFPVIMPPWILSLGKGRRLTFVDGGYADSSGTATALQLYNKLKSIKPDNVDLYLITLTDKLISLSDTDAEPVGEARVQSWFYDFLSPVTTLLSVRDLQSRKAVTEAYRELENKMIVIRLDQKAFPLPLGWKLSGLSSDIIRFTIGTPESCDQRAARDETAVFAAVRNSCELRRLSELLSAH